MFGISGWAQTLTIDNQTPCDVMVVVRATDGTVQPNGTLGTPCNLGTYFTNQIVIPGNASYVVTLADLTTTPATSPFFWTYVRYHDPLIFSCTTTGGMPCNEGVNHVGDPNCGLAVPNSCMTYTACSPSCAGVVVNAAWNWVSPVDVVVTITP